MNDSAKEIIRDKVVLYSYIAGKMNEYIEIKPDVLSVQQAKSVLARYRVPNILKSIVLKEMIEMDLLEKVPCKNYKYALRVKSKEKLLENTSKLYHQAGLW